MKRTVHPSLSHVGLEALTSYEHWVHEREDLTPASIRNYLSDLRHFIAWYEIKREAYFPDCLTPHEITSPALMWYRAYLQTVGRQKPALVNHSFISLKRYFGWVTQQHLIAYDPSIAVKLFGQEESAPRHLDDQAEQALVAAVTKAGTLRDRVLIVLLLYTGLHAREICRIRRDQVKLGKWSGFLEIIGKRKTYREVPLNATTRKLLEGCLATFPAGIEFLFPSGKTKETLSEQALGYIVNKYARVAKLSDVSPCDLRQSVQGHRLTQIMSHDSLDTIKLYIQRTKHNLQQAVETIAWT